MNFNIALNTIIYIMVFLFPGILFRRFYFSGQHSRQFNHGNLLERFLFTLFCGILCLISCGFIIYIINVELELELYHNISFDTISAVLSDLAKNVYPEHFQNPVSLVEIGSLMLIIYVLSGTLGILCYKIVRVLSFDKFMSSLRFNNDWAYLGEANNENGVKKNFLDIHKTYVDILTENKDQEVLYKGEFKNFLFDKENKLENVVISDASKFIEVEKKEENKDKIDSLLNLVAVNPNIFKVHQEYTDKYVFRKNIVGQLFVIPAGNILNVNFTYIKYGSKLERWKATTIKSLQILIYLGLALLFISLFIKLDNKYLGNFWNKLVFMFFTAISYILIMTSFIGLLQVPMMSRKNILENFIFTTTFLTPYIWVFTDLKWYNMILIFFTKLFFDGWLLTQYDKRHPKNPPNNNPN